MKKISKIGFILALLFSFCFIATLDAEKKEVNKTFKKKTEVIIQTVSGDCNVEKGKGDKIHVRLTYTFSPETFKPEFLERGDTLVLKENFYGSSSGMSEWSVTAPENTKIKFRSASGDFSVKGMKEEISAKTASGDIEGENIRGNFGVRSASGEIEIEDIEGTVDIKTASGNVDGVQIKGEVSIKSASGDIEIRKLDGQEVELKVASGDIEIVDARGVFDIKSASGDIDAKGVEITNESSFKTASGEVYVKLSKSTKFDLTIASASGDAVLDYNGNPVFGYFEFIARADRGRIIAPFRFDKEEEFFEYGQTYMKKWFQRKSDSPKIMIKTASGKAVLKK